MYLKDILPKNFFHIFSHINQDILKIFKKRLSIAEIL